MKFELIEQGDLRVLGIGLVVILFLVASNSFHPIVASDTYNEDYVTYKNSNMMFELRMPSSWNQISDIDRVIFLPPNGTDNNKYNERLEIIKFPDTSASRILGMYNKFMTGFYATDLRNSTLTNGLTIYSILRNYLDSEQVITKSVDLVSQINNDTYLFSYKARPSTFYLYLHTIIDIMNSIRFTNPNYSTIALNGINLLSEYFKTSDKTNLTLLATLSFPNQVPISVVSDNNNNIVYSVTKTNLSESSNLTEFDTGDILYAFNNTSYELVGKLRLQKGQQIIEMVSNPVSSEIFGIGVENYVNASKKMANDTLYIFRPEVGQPGSLKIVEKLVLSSGPYYNKEGGLSGIALDPLRNKVYVAMKYYMGGYNGIFQISKDDRGYHKSSFEMKKNGPRELVINSNTGLLYTADPVRNEVTVINATIGTMLERIILDDPRAMAVDPELNKLYLATQKNNWFNIIDLSTNKVISAVTGIKSASWSAVDTNSSKAYVVDSNEGKGYFNGEDSFLYELDGISNKMTDDYIILDALLHKVSINEHTGVLYAIGSNSKDVRGVNNDGRIYIISYTTPIKK